MPTTEMPIPGWHLRRRAAALFLVVALASGACGRGESPSRFAEAREDVSFRTLSEMYATADLVVEAEISSTRRGRTVGGEAPLTFRSVELKVLQTIKGTPARTLHVEEVGWDDVGPIEINDVKASAAGSHGYFFLTKTDARAGTYRLVSSQGRLLIDEEVIHASNHHGEPGASVDGMSVMTLERELLDAERQVRAGEVQSVATTAPEEPRAVGSPIQVATGRDSGGAWKVVATRSTTGYCYGIGYGSPRPNRCFTDEEVQSWLSEGKATMFRNTSPGVTLGLLPSEAETVTLDDGTPGRRPTVIRPKAMPEGWRGIKAFAVTSEGPDSPKANYTTKTGETKEIEQ